MSSREIGDLSLEMQVLFNRLNDKVRRDTWFLRNGISLLLICTYRSEEEQAKLYAQGRTTPGRKVTNAKWSKHNATTPQGKPASLAFDGLLLRRGTAIWGTSGDGVDDDPSDDDKDDLEAWQRYGAHAKSVGLVWGGDWKLRDYPHCEMSE
jgi:peptidoglycan L-alanyl-D-glutamate endopeptidase CwlK